MIFPGSTGFLQPPEQSSFKIYETGRLIFYIIILKNYFDLVLMCFIFLSDVKDEPARKIQRSVAFWPRE